jgi:hypothetical protein
LVGAAVSHKCSINAFCCIGIGFSEQNFQSALAWLAAFFSGNLGSVGFVVRFGSDEGYTVAKDIQVII